MIKKKRRSCIDLDIRNSKVFSSELGTFEWWISGFILDLLDLLNKACSPLVINLQINYPIGIKDITFKSTQLTSDKLFLIQSLYISVLYIGTLKLKFQHTYDA